MYNFDKDFIFQCIKNDLDNQNLKGNGDGLFEITSLEGDGKIISDFKGNSLKGKINFVVNKDNIRKSVCDYANSKIFSVFVRYGVLSYLTGIKNDNEFILEVLPAEEDKSSDILEDISIEDLFYDDINFYIINKFLQSKSEISSLETFKTVIDSLFELTSCKKGKNNRYSFFVSGLNLNKEKASTLKTRADQIPNIDKIEFSDCLISDKSFISNLFERSTKIVYNC